MITAFALATASLIAAICFVAAEAIRKRDYNRRYEHMINRMIELERR